MAQFGVDVAEFACVRSPIKESRRRTADYTTCARAPQLPIESAVSAITMAELAAGPHATQDADERARRQDRLQRAEAVFDPLPFDSEASRAYGRIYAAVLGAGRKARGARAVDLLIAATACSTGLPLYTRNPDDFHSLHDLIEVVPV